MAEAASRRTRRERGEAGDGSEPRKKKRKRGGRAAKEPEPTTIESKNLAGGDPGEEFDGSSRDPLEVLGSDLVTRVVEFLDARSVARLLVVSRGWHEIASSDRLWAPKCEELWVGKAHIPRLRTVRGASKLATYSMCIMDGKRTRISQEDLCDHVWEFRFKKTAPEYWLNLDPSWKGTGPPMRRYFHPNGSQTADPDDQVWGGHECTFSIITSYVGEGQIREHYVRINRWPRITVSRKDDWSWELSNQLYCYNSVPDAEKEGGTGPLFPVW
ncbi:uncharacterized protein A4U43_C04F2550 [Asparagus officinalis]|uniref:F-box domain-containing protein n=1 Tax=Asparagus officinalis TaxID=4686 RepID=A0A5P1F0E8_ASPOF|nr:uncharacterized protein A4U43_C04F2550 [Asparagus officinalis]